jgi:hypothetical protein
MYLGPFELHDIINTGKKVRLEVTIISFDPDDKLYLLFSSEENPDETATVDSCREHNDKQVSSINQSIGEVRDFLSSNPDSTKRKNQLEYLSNTLDHFVNFYSDNKLPLPDVPIFMPNKMGIFSAKEDFSEVSIGGMNYQLTPSQSKIVKVLYESACEGVDKLTYQEIANRTGLTSYSRLSSYFQAELRVFDLFKYSKRDRRYSLITE